MIHHPTKEMTDVHLDIFLITELSCVKVIFEFDFDNYSQRRILLDKYQYTE